MNIRSARSIGWRRRNRGATDIRVERAGDEFPGCGLEVDGIDVARIEKQYGVTLASRFDPLASCGLVERNGDMVRLAPTRLSVSNEVFVELLR